MKHIAADCFPAADKIKPLPFDQQWATDVAVFV